MKSYSEKLRDPRWQRKRLRIFERDKFTCQICGREDITLVVHHHSYQNADGPWATSDEDLVTLCQMCHATVEDAKAKISRGMSRGFGGVAFLYALESLLASAGLDPKWCYEKPEVED